MVLKRKDELFIEMVTLAERAIEDLSEDDIQELFGSDGFHEIKNYIKYEVMNLWRNGRLMRN
ncbi:hypothetical protein WKH57_25870 [Niallia taxi]|uniref:hypothetical protein n=1 Tax=Niallia taxi TaxID=2499688 RepID=UPI0031710808